MGTKEQPGAFDCYEAAEPDEPMFVLLARDPLAPLLVEAWAQMRYELAALKHGIGSIPNREVNKIKEANGCAYDMRHWREEKERTA